MIPTVLRLFYDLLTLKNDANIASKSNKQKNLKQINLIAVSKVTDENSRIRIHSKMSWIGNTDRGLKNNN
jgi:hypothetical protein